MIKTGIFEPTAGARCTIFPKVCMVIEHVETIKKLAKMHSFSYRVDEKMA